MRPEEVKILNALADARPNASGWWRVNCPFCAVLTGKPDTRQSMGVLPQKGIYTCFKCGIKEYSPNIVDDAQEFYVADVEPTPVEDKVFDPPDGYMPLYEEPGVSSLSLRVAREYMRSRGVTDSMGARLRIGASFDGPCANRIVIPIIDSCGEWRGWVGRTWHNNTRLRYLYPSGMKRTLFNESAVFEETDTPLLLVEGVFDAFPYWPNAAAFLGKPTSSHFDVLLEATRPLVVVLDADAHIEGWAFAAKLELAGLRAGSVRLQPPNDPATVERDWLVEQASLSITDRF